MQKAIYRNAQGRLSTVPQVCQESNLGQTTVRHIAAEAGAVVKIGRSYRIDREKFFDYISENYTC